MISRRANRLFCPSRAPASRSCNRASVPSLAGERYSTAPEAAYHSGGACRRTGWCAQASDVSAVWVKSSHLVCRLLLEKKKNTKYQFTNLHYLVVALSVTLPY